MAIINNDNNLLSDTAIELLGEKFREFLTLMTYYQCAIMAVETKLNVRIEEFSLQHDRNPIQSIKTRLKSPVSIKKKLESKNLPVSVEMMENELTDIAGIRVICSFPEDVYTIADALLSQDDIELIERKDYIANPKPNGYRSLHLIVQIPIFLEKKKKPMKVEVQLRTIAMDFWASLEHQIKYKKKVNNTQEIATELFECAELSAQLDARMDAVRKKLEQKTK